MATARRLARPGVKWALSKVAPQLPVVLPGWPLELGRREDHPPRRRWRDRGVESAPAPHRGARRMGQLPARRHGRRCRRHRDLRLLQRRLRDDKIADTPDVLDVALDKASYADGESLQVCALAALRRQGDARASSPTSSPDIRTIDIARRRHHRLPFPVKANGAPAPISSCSPIGRWTPPPSACPAAPSACPGSRSAQEPRSLALDLGAPQLVRPLSTLSLPVMVDRHEPGRGGLRHARRRRYRHPQSHPLREPRSEQILLRPAPARP